MKIAALFLSITFFLSTQLHAGAVKEVYTSAQEEIETYYISGGEWELLKVSDMNFAYKESIEFITLSAKTTIKNINTAKTMKETCLVTFIKEDLQFYAIACF